MTKPCIICLKPLADAADNNFRSFQPHQGGEIQFIFSYGSCKFDNKFPQTRFRGLICDECAEIYVERMEEF